jgi:hypothetical protein
MYSGTCCYYSAFDCKNIELCCNYEEDCLCLRHSGCLSCTAKSKGFGCTTDESKDECCMIGLGCCDCGLIKPKTCCAGACQVLCCYEVLSFPCSDNYVDKCVCAVCFLQCAPTCGCCVAPPECPALDKMQAKGPEAEAMDRGDEGEDKKEVTA